MIDPRDRTDIDPTDTRTNRSPVCTPGDVPRGGSCATGAASCPFIGMRTGPLLLGGLLTVALSLSWVSWTSDAAAGGGESVTLVAGGGDSSQRLHWSTSGDDVEIVAMNDEHGDWLQVTVRTVEDSSSGEGADAGAREDAEHLEGAAVGLTEPRGEVVFTGGPQARRLMEAAAPLRATRRLSGVTDDRLEPMGLASDVGRLEIVAGGETHRFQAGARTYGGGSQYLREPGPGHVYLIDAGPFRPLEHGARRLMKRELLDFGRSDIRGVSVSSPDGRQLEMLHRRAGDGSPRSFFADASEPERRADEYGNWIGKILALRVSEYVQPAEALTDLTSVALLSFTIEGRRLPVTLEVFEVPDLDGGSRWYARSDHTRMLVVLPPQTAASVLADLDAVLG